MSSIEFWTGNTEGQTAWNRLNLGGKVWPGIVDIDVSAERKIDVTKAKGKDKGELKDQGYENASLTIKLQITNQEQWDEVQRLLPDVHPKKNGGTRNTLEILHPKPNLLGITTIYIKKITPGTPSAKSGMVITFEAIEMSKPTPVTPKSGAAGSIDAEIAKLNKKIAELDALIKDSLTPGKPNFGDVQFHAEKTAQRKAFVEQRDALLAQKKPTKGTQPKAKEKPKAPGTENIF